MLEVLRRHRTLAAVVALGLALPFAASAQQTPGLGQAWPNAKDFSRSPGWHVYVFQMNGIEYIEVADLTGRIVGAVGTANHQYISLPVGAFSQYVSIPHQVAPLPRGVTVVSSPIVVYQDEDTTVTVTSTSDGGVATRASASAGCTNPVECNTNIQ